MLGKKLMYYVQLTSLKKNNFEKKFVLKCKFASKQKPPHSLQHIRKYFDKKTSKSFSTSVTIYSISNHLKTNFACHAVLKPRLFHERQTRISLYNSFPFPTGVHLLTFKCQNLAFVQVIFFNLQFHIAPENQLCLTDDPQKS